MLKLPSPLESIIDEANRAIAAGFYRPAILTFLTLPEVCSALVLAKTDHVKQAHYVSFIENYSAYDEIGLSGLECYGMRGGVVHRANAVAHQRLSEYTHVIFGLPESGLEFFGRFEHEGQSAIFIDLARFAQGMEKAVLRWYDANKDNPMIDASASEILRWRPNGVMPFFRGPPVIASGPE